MNKTENRSIFEIDIEYLNIINEIIDNEGEADEELFQRLLDVESELTTKVKNYVNIMDKLEMEEEALNKKIKRLQAAKNRRKNARERLKQNLIYVMTTSDMKKLSTDDFNVTVTKGSVKVDELDLSVVPSDYLKEKKEYSVDKEKVRKLYKENEEIEIPGVKVYRNPGLRVY